MDNLSLKIRPWCCQYFIVSTFIRVPLVSQVLCGVAKHVDIVDDVPSVSRARMFGGHSKGHTVPIIRYILLEKIGEGVTWLSAKWTNASAPVNNVSLLVAPHYAASIALTLSPMTIGATSWGVQWSYSYSVNHTERKWEFMYILLFIYFFKILSLFFVPHTYKVIEFCKFWHVIKMYEKEE